MNKHTEIIKAWKNGADIQCLRPFGGEWVDCSNPSWLNSVEYRIKPHKLPTYIIAERNDNGLLYHHVGPFGTYEESVEYIKRLGKTNYIVIELNDPQEEI